MGQKEIYKMFDTVKLLLYCKLVFLRNVLLRISLSPGLLNCALSNMTSSARQFMDSNPHVLNRSADKQEQVSLKGLQEVQVLLSPNGLTALSMSLCQGQERQSGTSRNLSSEYEMYFNPDMTSLGYNPAQSPL